MDKEGDPKLLVWTLPTRLFHWTFGTCITLALLSGEGIISMSMEQHMWVGGVALALILFRLFWGFVASDYARFDRFSLNILQLPNYAAQLFRRAPTPHAGHSPAGSWSVMLILIITLTQAVTGLMTSDAIFTEGPLVPFVDNNMVNLATDIHHLVSKLVIGIVILHLLAVFYYEVICKQRIIGAMITGHKNIEGAPAKTRPAIAVMLLTMAGGLVWLIFALPQIW